MGIEMRSRVELGPLTGQPIVVTEAEPHELAAYHDSLVKAGIPEGALWSADDCLPMLLDVFDSPHDCAEALAVVVNTMNVGPDRYVMAAMAVRGIIRMSDRRRL